MDPLAIFYDIHELIIQHFSYSDIFIIYKVSKSWCDLVLENSNFAMRKIKLNVQETNHDEVVNVLEQKISEINSDFLGILESKRKYQNIKIYVDHGWDFTDQLVRNLAESLVDVEVLSDIYVENLKIPNLKYLKLDDVLVDGLTSCSNNLTKLAARLSGKEYWLKKESPIAVKTALKNNSYLESLELGDVLTDLIFEHDISSKINFKLKRLSLEFTKFNSDENVFMHARNFLAKQNELNTLTIKFPDCFTIQWIYKNLVKLETLNTKIHFENNPRTFVLPINGTIKELDIDISSNWQYTMSIKYALRTFITSSPNLEVLKMRCQSPLEIDDFRFLLFNASKLKELIQNAGECLHTYREIYEQIRQDHDNISPNIEILNF